MQKPQKDIKAFFPPAVMMCSLWKQLVLAISCIFFQRCSVHIEAI